MSDDQTPTAARGDEADVVSIIRLVNTAPLRMPDDVVRRIDEALALEAANR